MKRVMKRLISLACCAGAVFGAVRFGPAIGVRFFGSSNTQWISEQFSQTLREKNELIVYEVETTGQETVSQEAWLIGTVQKVILPYTFQMQFTVDLSQASVSADGNIIRVSIPEPAAGYHKLTVKEDEIQKVDWLYPLTTERYAELVRQVEEKLFENAASNPEFQKSAWDHTVQNLESLFASVADESFLGRTCEIQIVPLSGLEQSTL